VNGSTETDWQRKTAKALIIEATPEKRLGPLPPFSCGCGFFRCVPFQSVRSIPLPKAFPLFRLVVIFRPAQRRKASGNVGERINRNGMVTEVLSHCF
jgi:hypothetical protein